MNAEATKWIVVIVVLAFLLGRMRYDLERIYGACVEIRDEPREQTALLEEQNDQRAAGCPNTAFRPGSI